MRRWMGWIAIAWLLALSAVALVLYGHQTAPQSLSDRTRAVASGLRCLVCQGESVADSPSGFSVELRARIESELRAGDTPAQIDARLIRAYGDQIVLAPPRSGLGALAWWGPPLLLLGGSGLLITLVLDWRSRSRQSDRSSRADYVRRVRAELAAGADDL